MPVVPVLLIIVIVLLLAGSLVGLAFELLWLVVTGLIIGALGRLVLPGRQDVSLPMTALVGIGASLLGGILADLADAGWLVKFLVAGGAGANGGNGFSSGRRGRHSGGLDPGGGGRAGRLRWRPAGPESLGRGSSARHLSSAPFGGTPQASSIPPRP